MGYFLAASRTFSNPSRGTSGLRTHLSNWCYSFPPLLTISPSLLGLHRASKQRLRAEPEWKLWFSEKILRVDRGLGQSPCVNSVRNYKIDRHTNLPRRNLQLFPSASPLWHLPASTFAIHNIPLVLVLSHVGQIYVIILGTFVLGLKEQGGAVDQSLYLSNLYTYGDVCGLKLKRLATGLWGNYC